MRRTSILRSERLARRRGSSTSTASSTSTISSTSRPGRHVARMGRRLKGAIWPGPRHGGVQGVIRLNRDYKHFEFLFFVFANDSCPFLWKCTYKISWIWRLRQVFLLSMRFSSFSYNVKHVHPIWFKFSYFIVLDDVNINWWSYMVWYSIPADIINLRYCFMIK